MFKNMSEGLFLLWIISASPILQILKCLLDLGANMETIFKIISYFLSAFNLTFPGLK